MLLIGRHRTRTCQGPTRRALLQAGAISAVGLSLPDLLRLRTLGAGANGTAKSVLFLWLWGGPAHLDTWDPKPNAALEYRGPFDAIPTRAPGVRFGELFPQVANLADKFAVIRSMRTDSNDHGVAGTAGLTGSSSGAVNLGGTAAKGAARPATGSVVARVRAA